MLSALSLPSPHTLLHNPDFLPGEAVEVVNHAVDFAVGLGDLGLEVPGFLFLLVEVLHPFGFFAEGKGKKIFLRTAAKKTLFEFL